MKTILKIEGMMCGMCEAHINDAIRKNFDVENVESSHIKGTTEVESVIPLPTDRLREVIADTGYKLTDITREH